MSLEVARSISYLLGNVQAVVVGQLALILIVFGRSGTSEVVLQVALVHELEDEELRLTVVMEANAQQTDDVLVIELVHDDRFFEKVDALSRRSGTEQRLQAKDDWSPWDLLYHEILL